MVALSGAAPSRGRTAGRPCCGPSRAVDDIQSTHTHLTCMYVYVRMYVCMYVRTYVRMHVCMYVCMY